MTLPDYQTGGKPRFRWTYIALSIAVLVLSLVLTGFFFPHLPDRLAYHFTVDGIPDRWMGRSQFILISLLPQVLLTIVAAATAGVMTWLSPRFKAVNMNLKLENIINLMGNIVALPEIVLAVFMLDVYLFNVFNVYFLPIWALGVIVMLIGGLVFAVFFFRTVRESRRATK